MIDSYNTGNPISVMMRVATTAAKLIDYFAGLISTIQGDKTNISYGSFHYILREPLGVVGRIVASSRLVMSIFISDTAFVISAVVGIVAEAIRHGCAFTTTNIGY
jgi:acyl-CoA reductase-like NAD-dependent aldehyde dehydrogenase